MPTDQPTDAGNDGRQVVEHELKCWPEFFSAILTGEKTFELRKDDRQPPFRAGDVLWLREWRRGDKEYTGRDLRVTVTYVLSGFGLEKDYVVMGFQLPAIAHALAAARREGQAQELEAIIELAKALGEWVIVNQLVARASREPTKPINYSIVNEDEGDEAP